MNRQPDIPDHPARILIVDDEAHNRRLLEVMLAPEGFILKTAAGGEEALAIVAQEPPDLILLDVMMPGMDGYQVAGRIKGDITTKNIPIIIVTALDDRDAMLLGLRAGAEDFLTKPVDRAELRVRVRNLLRLKAYSDYHDKYSQMLEGEVGSRTAELVASERRYRHIVETSTEGVCSLDAEMRITFANGAFARMLGCTPEEMLGTPVEQYTFPTEFDEFRSHMAARRRGVAERYERRLRRKDGKECWCIVSGAPILDSDGRFAGSFGMFTDITDRRRLEEQLRQSQKMEAVGRLAGGVAHDFNNLLTVIFGYSDVVLQGLEPGPLREAMQEVRRAGERAAALTRQLLAFSRKQALVPEILDMGDVVSGLSTMVERLIGEDIKVSVVVSPGLGRVKADRGQLEQVVMNLAVNARDAMPKGGSLVLELQNVELDDAYTATHAEVEPGPYVLLAISDTGTGMDAETQKRIFDPFFTTKETGKGTGLGLSTVHGIVHQSGGSIDVYSEPGQGTTFKVYLPLFAGDAAAPRPISGARKALPTGSETVLVVEDEAAIRQLTNVILKKAGYTVLLAESPVAAERIAGGHPGPIHLMLTDVVMPGMRGPELAERLFRLRPGLRVLYMSGYTDDAIAHHGFLDAGTSFLQKPFTPLGLMQKIREVLDAGRPE